ncbi:hypothetical protein [Paenibacillus sp. CMAA1364]
MKKIGVIIGVCIVSIALYVFINKLYYPSFPIDGVSAKEAIKIMSESDREVAEVAATSDSIWYVTRSNDKHNKNVDDKIKEMIVSNGWEFKDKEGSGLFFEKDKERLIVTTQMWTSHYVLVKIPSNYIKT